MRHTIWLALVAIGLGVYLLDMNVFAAAPAGEWWNSNYQYRQKITITTTDAIQTGHTVGFTVNTSTLVAGGKLRFPNPRFIVF